MLKFKSGKLVECTKDEFDKIELIYQNSTSVQKATETLYIKMVYGKIPYKAESNRVSTKALESMAFNAILAVKAKYKYLKIIGK